MTKRNVQCPYVHVPRGHQVILQFCKIFGILSTSLLMYHFKMTVSMPKSILISLLCICTAEEIN